MSLLTKKAGIHENASTQINVPKDIADQIIAIGKELIPDEHLAGEGRSMQPHITVKYGVQPNEGLLQQALAGRASFPVSLGNTVAFVAGSTGANAANNGTPLVIEVHGHELDALHDAVMQAMGTLPDDLPYVPHITVAYLKPDEAQHYVGNDAFVGIKFTAEAVALSPYDDSKQVEVPLAKAAASPAQVTPEIPQVQPQTPQQEEPEEEEVKRDQPATPPRQQRDTPAADPRHERAKPAPKKRQPKLLQPKAPKPPAKNPDFKKWFGKSKVTDSSGKPLVVYHGTTHDFTTFDPSKTTKDSFYGQGLYFTSSKKDLENYATDVGPDITRRVEFQSERVMQEWEDSWDEVKDQLGMGKLDEFPSYGTYERDELNEKAKQEAKKEIAGGSGGMSMPVYLSLQNPVIIQKRGGTEFHIDMEEDENGDFTGEESGTGVDLYNAMMLVAGNFDSADAQDVWNDLIGNNGSDFTAYDFEQLVRNGNWEFTDSNGDMAAGSFIAEVYQELGFDGIIQDAYAEFGPRPSGYAGGKLPGMQMDQDTKHYILWDSSKIKSAIGNVGKYDPQNPNITAAYEEEEIEEYTPESWEEKWTLQPGTTLYHGSSNEWEEGSELQFPAWFSTNKKVANWFAHRNGEGTPVIRMYRVSNPYELVVLNDARDIQGFRDMYNIEDGGDPNALAESVINAGFEGWIIPDNYRPGDDIMLGDGSGIEYMEQHPADAKSSDFFATGSVLAANEKSVGNLGLAKKIVHEMLPVLGVPLPEPELKIVNQPRANWLGSDNWQNRYSPQDGWTWDETTTISLQKSILNDENTLRRVIAHELCHHAEALTTTMEKAKEQKARNLGDWGFKEFGRYLRGGGHGAEWRKWAQKMNAKYGADFVTEKSDESYAVEEQELRPFHILLKRDYDGKLAYEVSSRITAKMKRQLDRMASEKEGTEYRLTQTNDRRFYEGNLIGSHYWSRSKDENIHVTLEELWAKAQKILPTGAAKEQDEVLNLMREKMTGPGWQRPGRASLFQKQAIPQIEQLEHGVSKDYDRVAYVYNQMYSNRTPTLSWKDFQKTFPREQNSPLFTQIRQNRPQITLADLDRWLEEYKEKAKEYQNYNLEHATYKDKATSFRDVEQLVLRINQSASAAEIIGEDEMLRFFLQQAEQGSRQSGHPVGKDTVGWLRVDFVNDDWLLIDEVQSDLINAVELGMKFISEPSLESLMTKYKSETVKQKIRDMGATEQMFQHSKREFARRGYTMEKFQEMKQSLANLFKDWAEYGIASIIEIARRHGIKNVAIHTGTTIAKRDPDLEADKAVMYYDNLAKSFGFKKQQVDVGGVSGEFWTRTASKTAGKRDEAVTTLTFGVDVLGFPSPVLVRWEQGMRWREVLKAVKAIAGEIAEKRIPWGDINIWASLWDNRQQQEEGWEAQKAKGRVMYDVLHNGSFVRVDNAAQPVAMGAEEIPTDQPPTAINGVPVYASFELRVAADLQRTDRDLMQKFIEEMGVKEKEVTPNSTWSYVDTPKGQTGLYMKDTYDSDANTVEIHWLTAQKRGSGRAALERLCELADKHGIKLALWAVPLAGQGENLGFSMKQKALEAWYKDFGFKVKRRDQGTKQKYAWMTRDPKKQKAGSHKTPPLSDTRYENPAQGEETNAYANIPERVKGFEELPSLEELAPQMFVKDAAKSLKQALMLCRSNIARKAQEIYDSWEQDAEGVNEELGTGGICDEIAEAISDLVANVAFEVGGDVTEGGQEGDDHAWVIAYTKTEVYGVDIPHSVYETGGGYSWKKIPGVTFTAEDVEIFPLDIDPSEFAKQGGARGSVPEGTTFRTEVQDAPRGQIDAQAQAWLNGERIGYVNFAVTEIDTELDDTRYWRKQQDDYGADEWERIAEIPEQAWVKYVYVHPDYRRMGIATGMYEQIKKDYPGIQITSSGTTDEGGKMRSKMKERGMFASVLFQKKAVYGEAQNQVQHTDHTPVGMYKVLKSNPFADEIEALRMSEGEEAPELNPVLPNEGRKGEGQPQAKNEDRIGEKLKDNGGAGNIGRTSSKQGAAEIDEDFSMMGKTGPFYRIDSMRYDDVAAYHGKRFADKVKNKQPVTVYRAGKPGEQLTPGTFLSADKRMAQSYQHDSTESFGGPEMYTYQVNPADLLHVENFEASELVWKPRAKKASMVGPVYHGTSANFEKYESIYKLYYFTDDPEYAHNFLSRTQPGTMPEGSNIRRAFLKINKPFDARELPDEMSVGELWDAIGGEDGQRTIKDTMQILPFWKWLRSYSKQVKAELQRQGYDGIIQNETLYIPAGDAGGPGAISYVVFDQNQIKWSFGKAALKLTNDTPTGTLKAALDEITESFPVNPMNPKEHMVLDGNTPVAVFEVAGRNGKLRLKDIRSLEKGTGGGRAALQAVTAIADKHGVEMELTASPFGDEKTRLNKDNLQAWYRRNNFEDEPGYDPALGYMVRKPKTSAGKVDIDWDKNMYGKFKLTVEHSWHEHGDPIDDDENVGEANWNLLIVNAFDTTKKQAGQPGKWVGSAEFVLRHGDLESCNTEVDPKYWRQGIATAMYQFAEGFTGHATSPHNEQSPAGRALWNQKGRPFGASLLQKQASNVISGEQVVDYVQKQHPGWSRQQCYQIVGLDAGGDYILTDEYDLDKLEAGDDYDPALAERYAKMKTPLPPIILDMDGKIRDGNHRVAAGKLRGDSYIAAYEPLDTYDPSEGKTGALYAPNWVKPNLAEEQGEITRSAPQLGVAPEALTQALKKGQLVALNNNLWSKLENTDSWETTTPELAKQRAGAYSRDIDRIYQGLKARASQMPAPIVVVKKDGTPYLLAGNTRLMAARSINIVPAVWLGKL